MVVANFDELEKPEYAQHFKGIDVAFNAFGTTRSDAGGADQFRKIGQRCALLLFESISLMGLDVQTMDTLPSLVNSVLMLESRMYT